MAAGMAHARPRRILLLQHLLRPYGGANLVAAWMIEALRTDHSLTLLTWEPVDWAAVRRYYGVAPSPADLRVITVPAAVRALRTLDPDPESIQPLGLLMRTARRIGGAYDVCIAACDEVDFGQPGVQYVHYPALGRLANEGEWLERDRSRRPTSATLARLRPWRLLSGFSFARMRRNLTLVNSDWTGDLVRRVYDIEPVTLYPPVPPIRPLVPWEEREEGIVCIGRFVPEKQFDQAILIVARLRADRPGLRLHLVGSPSLDRPSGRAYHQALLRRARAAGGWIHIHENLSRAELHRLLARQRYGLHMAPKEHFGLAVAELAMAGCIVFVPNSGGQVEIVGSEPRLRYNSNAEVVATLRRVMGSPSEQAELRWHLAEQCSRFTADVFVRRLRDLVDHFDAHRHDHQNGAGAPRRLGGQPW
jgi:glycosyltransferase involved in cell wall biosynthesis